jgi:hypothetical protein
MKTTVKRSGGKILISIDEKSLENNFPIFSEHGFVIISEKDFNSFQETKYLLNE